MADLDVRVILLSEKELLAEMNALYPDPIFSIGREARGQCGEEKRPVGSHFGIVTCTLPENHEGVHVAHVHSDDGTLRGGYSGNDVCAYWVRSTNG